MCHLQFRVNPCSFSFDITVNLFALAHQSLVRTSICTNNALFLYSISLAAGPHYERESTVKRRGDVRGQRETDL